MPAKAISEAAESRGYNSNSVDKDDDDNDFFDNERVTGRKVSKSYLRIENYVDTFLFTCQRLHFSDFHRRCFQRVRNRCGYKIRLQCMCVY